MKPIPSNKTIQKFRVVLSLPEMEAILSALHSDSANLIDNAELIGWISKNKRKAEFGIKEASHLSGPSVLTAKSEAVVEAFKESEASKKFRVYQEGMTPLSDAELLDALQYKAEHSLECGSLTEEESQVLNEAMTKKLLGGI